MAFSFLDSIGRVYPNVTKTETDPLAATSRQINESVDADSKPKNQSQGPKSISLYKPPIGDVAQRQCSFFVNQHTPEIRSSVASFRRHQTEEKLRKEWSKQRAPIVKFYKQERKSALRHLRKGMGKPKENEKEKEI
uniref:TPX2 C-terminal domain-containing protein n=1 Tax=Globodera rostochiensis TaxID=31243 RepID=A0A914HBW8_GLORO